jgi:GTP-binding protein HflX
VILHVRDVAHEDTEAQAHDVAEVLRQLEVDPDDGRRLIEVWNKIDLLAPERRLQLANIVERRPPDGRPVLVSAVTGEGLDGLEEAIDARVAAGRVVLDVTLDPADGAGSSWLHRHAEVLAKASAADGRLTMTVRVDKEKADQVRRKFGVLAQDAGRAKLRAVP